MLIDIIFIEKKLHSHHTQSQVKRKEPGIIQLANKYNKLCRDMAQLKQEKKAPLGALVPPEINREGLFDLDVDDDIWQDIGLDESTDNSDGVPKWLGDENVRQGIKSLLELDRCNEEEERLSKERCAMQDWMIEEWICVKTAMEQCSDIYFEYQLQLRAEALCRLCASWMAKISSLPCYQSMPVSWGPSQGEIDNALQSSDNKQINESDEEEEEEELEEAEYEMEEDLVEAIERTAFTDAYQTEYSGFSEFGILRESVMFSTPVHSRNTSPVKGGGSPRKRNRVYELDDE